MSPRVLAALALLAGAGAAHAETTTRADARILTLTANSSADVTISATGGSGSGIVIQSDGECAVNGGGGAAVVDTDSCAGDLRIKVPRGAVLTVTQNGSGAVAVTGDAGPTVVTMSGDGSFRAERVTNLVLSLHASGDAVVDEVKSSARLDLSGSGDTRLKSVLGALVVKQQGSGDLVVGHIASPGVEYESNGSGGAMIGGGDIGAFNARLNGSGDLAVAATVGAGNVAASGGGDVKLAKVRGPLSKHASGGSTISVSDSTLAGVAIDAASQVAANIDSIDLDGKSNDSHTVHVVRMHRDSSGGHHVFAGLVVLGLLVWVLRVMQRNGALQRFMSRTGRAAAPAAPSHPGVVAVRDALARLDARLGRVEGYVTSREFELQRGFRDLEK